MDELARVFAFHNRLVAFVNYVGKQMSHGGPPSAEARAHIGLEQAGLVQDYGRVYATVKPYGVASMTQFGGIVSQDVVRDAIGRLDHPSYPSLANMAVQHLNWIIGLMRADVENRPARRAPDNIYRLTSPVFWLGRFGAGFRWLLGTNGGRIAAAGGTVVLAIISGAAQAVFTKLIGG
jgi:hypothetical protein